jgi:hypothetical protein
MTDGLLLIALDQVPERIRITPAAAHDRGRVIHRLLHLTYPVGIEFIQIVFKDFLVDG